MAFRVFLTHYLKHYCARLAQINFSAVSGICPLISICFCFKKGNYATEIIKIYEFSRLLMLRIISVFSVINHFQKRESKKVGKLIG